MGMSGITKSQVSRLWAEIDGKVDAFLDRPVEGDGPCPRLAEPIWTEFLRKLTRRRCAGEAGGLGRPSGHQGRLH